MKEYNEKYKLIHAERMKDPEYREKRRKQRAAWKKWEPSEESHKHLLEYKKEYYKINKEAILKRQKDYDDKKKADKVKEARERTLDVTSFCVKLE